MAKTVRALRDGFYKTRRRAGSVFQLTDEHKIGQWMEELSPQEAETALAEAKQNAFVPKVERRTRSKASLAATTGKKKPGVKGRSKDLA